MKLAIFCALVQAEHKIQAKGSLCDCSIEKRKALVYPKYSPSV